MAFPSFRCGPWPSGSCLPDSSASVRRSNPRVQTAYVLFGRCRSPRRGGGLAAAWSCNPAIPKSVALPPRPCNSLCMALRTRSQLVVTVGVFGSTPARIRGFLARRQHNFVEAMITVRTRTAPGRDEIHMALGGFSRSHTGSALAVLSLRSAPTQIFGNSSCISQPHGTVATRPPTRDSRAAMSLKPSDRPVPVSCCCLRRPMTPIVTHCRRSFRSGSIGDLN